MDVSSMSWQWKNYCEIVLRTRKNCFLTAYRKESSGNELFGNSNLSNAIRKQGVWFKSSEVSSPSLSSIAQRIFRVQI